MKFLKHFIFGANADDFRKGKVFLEDENKNKNSESGDENLEKTPASKADIEKILAKIDDLESKKNEERSSADAAELEKLKNQAAQIEQKAVDLSSEAKNVRENVGRVQNGEKVVDLSSSNTEKSERGAVDETKKEVLDSVKDTINDSEKIDETGEKTEEEQKAADSAKAKALSDDLLKDHNEVREQQSLHDFQRHRDNISSFEKDLIGSRDKIDLKNRKIEENYRAEIDEAKVFSSKSYEGLLVFSEKLVTDEKSLDVFKETKDLADNLQKKVSHFKLRFKEISEEGDIPKKRHKSVVAQADFKEFLRGFESGGVIFNEFSQHRKKVEGRMKEVFPASTHDWINDYWKDFGASLKKQQEYVKTLKHYADEKLLLDPEADFWDTLKNKTDEVSMFFDFTTKKGEDEKKGFLHEGLDFEGKRLGWIKEGKDFLEENGFWDDREEFEDKFKKLQKGYLATTKDLQKNNNQLKKITTKWAERLDDSRFRAKFGKSKEAVVSLIEKNEAEIEKRKNTLRDLGDKDFYENWLSSYKKGGVAQADALVKISDFADMQKYEDESIQNVKDLQQAIDSDKPDPNDRIDFAFVDLWNLFENYIEKRESDWNSRSASATAKLGAAILDEDSIYKSKYAADANAEDDKEAKEFEEYFDGLSTGEIKDEMYKVTDKIKLRAAIDVLIRRADFFWRDKNLLNAFNACAGRVVFESPDKIVEEWDDSKLMEEVYEVVSKMFDKAKANLWSGQYVAESMKKNGDADYGVEAHKIVEEPKRFRDAMNGAFSDFYRGNIAPVDKAYYLSFIRKALQRRKMNSGPNGDDALWYLIMGLSIGFFTEEDMAEISTDFKGGFPVVDFFTDSQASKKDGWIVESSMAEEVGAKTGRWGRNDFIAWRDYFMGGKKFTGKPEDFSMELQNSGRKDRFKNFYYQNMVKSLNYKVTSSFLASGIKNVDPWDHSLWAPMLMAGDIGTITTLESAGQKKVTEEGFIEFMKGYNDSIEGMWRALCEDEKKMSDYSNWADIKNSRLERIGEVLQAGLLLSETLVGNANLGDKKDNATFSNKYLKDGSPAMDARNKLHEVVYSFLDDSGDRSDYEPFLQKKMVYDPGVTANDKKETKAKMNVLISEEAGVKIFQDADRVERVMKKRFGGGA